MHMVMGNIMGEGSAAAQTNVALKYTAGWGNDWLRHGLEHLSGDEIVHVNFGKRWGKHLALADSDRYWEEGKRQAHVAVAAIEVVRQDFGYTVDPGRQCERVDREFDALLQGQPATAVEPVDRDAY